MSHLGFDKTRLPNEATVLEDIRELLHVVATAVTDTTADGHGRSAAFRELVRFRDERMVTLSDMEDIYEPTR